MAKKIYTWFDIKPTKKDLERLEDKGTRYDNKWFLDGKFIGTTKLNALRALKRKLFAEYKDGLRK